MAYVDTHTHLYDSAYGEDCDAAVYRAVEAGVKKLVFPDINSDSRDAMFALAGRNLGVVFIGLGLHPSEIKENWRDEIDAMMLHKTRKDLVAVGETGMDLYWSKEFIKEQEESFRIQIELALELDLPIIIHNREATEPVLKIVGDYKGQGLRGVFHAFTGSYETFCELDKLGDFYVGIGGVVTYKKASIAETIKRIPLERILSETDSPWLTPVPFRGKRNESSYIPYIIEKIAEQKETAPETVANVLWQNAHNLFRLL